MSAGRSVAFARRQIDEVRRQLLDSAAFGKHVTPDQLERMASKLAMGVRALDVAVEVGACELAADRSASSQSAP
ncbi:DUF6374 family protein [Nocardia nepalensis]|uniref:DUF6374 family protein n=1 Tax=Nocardia nepalensis TaxID=3375448 RepID=UPI003B6813FA